MKVVVFKVAENEYAIEIKYVCEVIRNRPIIPINDVPEYIEGIINLKGDIITVINMRKRFKAKDSKISKFNRIIIIKTNEQMYGMIVDSTEKMITMNQENISTQNKLLKGSEYLVGVGLENNRMIQIIDINKFMKENENIQVCLS